MQGLKSARVVNSDLYYPFEPRDEAHIQRLCESVSDAESLVNQRREALEDAELELEYLRQELEAAVNYEN